METTESQYIEALIKPTHIHSQTINKILLQLYQLFTKNKRFEDIITLELLAKTYDFKLKANNDNDNQLSLNNNYGSMIKRVVFCLDYSGSMSGSKIRAATKNLELIIKQHINNTDYIMLIHFTNLVMIDFELNLKEGNENNIIRIVTQLNSPNG